MEQKTIQRREFISKTGLGLLYSGLGIPLLNMGCSRSNLSSKSIYQKLDHKDFRIPGIESVITTIDTHTGGEPTRTVVGGAPSIPGKTMLEKMSYCRENLDWIRKALLYEPRGHSGMMGIILTEPTHPDADIGVIYLETYGYPPMCGHGTMGVCTALVESGLVKPEEPVTSIVLDTPAGLTPVKVHVEDGKAKSVSIRMTPSFVYAKDVIVKMPKYGKIIMDISYAGTFYAIIPATSMGIEIRPENAREIIEKGRSVRDAINAQIEIQHPEFDFMNSCTHIEFYGDPEDSRADVKNAVFFADSWIDRSPCGTGTAARMASLYKRGELKLNEEFVHESTIGSIFTATALEETSVGNYPAIITEVTGSAYIMGINQFYMDPEDPHRHGFKLN